MTREAHTLKGVESLTRGGGGGEGKEGKEGKHHEGLVSDRESRSITGKDIMFSVAYLGKSRC